MSCVWIDLMRIALHLLYSNWLWDGWWWRGVRGGWVYQSCRISGIAEPGQGLLLSIVTFAWINQAESHNKKAKLNAQMSLTAAAAFGPRVRHHFVAILPFWPFSDIVAFWLMDSAFTHHTHRDTHTPNSMHPRAEGKSQVASAARKS